MDAPLDPGLRAVLRLAWPTVLSFVLNNGFRINDQSFLNSNQNLKITNNFAGLRTGLTFHF